MTDQEKRTRAIARMEAMTPGQLQELDDWLSTLPEMPWCEWCQSWHIELRKHIQIGPAQLAERMKLRFPWLGSDDEVDCTNAVSELASWYNELTKGGV